jgi:hypothetical protein
LNIFFLYSLPPSSSRRQVTFDDDSSDERYETNQLSYFFLLYHLFYTLVILIWTWMLIHQQNKNQRTFIMVRFYQYLFDYSFCQYILDSDEHLDSSSNQNNGDLTSTLSSTSTRLSPTSAIRTIMSFYVRNNDESVQPKPVKLNRRVRIERKFGEDITNGNLLQELKEKAEAKKAKMKKKVSQESQRSSKKTN